MTRRPVITLTTDFGENDYYVGAMRGVILSLCPQANLVDITHHVTPYSALEGSFVLSQACRTFPSGTVHLAVVDPGVGGLRKPLIVSSGEHRFVGPDNGLFTPFLDRGAEIFRIREEGLAGGSDTFHGRDVFAPVAARLAGGEPPEALADATQQAVRLHIPRPRREGRSVLGEVFAIDRFGNLITNIHRRDLAHLEGELDIRVGTCRIPGLARTYDDGILGESLALLGSSGYLELAVVQGNASGQLGVGRGERVRVRALDPA
jgi:S-adenosylmethionine hydrolase